MKKITALLLILFLALGAACAETPAGSSVFETMADMEWEFCSGAGAWSTLLWIREDGSFIGEFHDSDMGDCTDEYPDGTVYLCSFYGQMGAAEQADSNTWKIRVDRLLVNEAEETIVDGTRYIPAAPYGLSEGDEMLLYGPGTPVSIFSEEMLLWTHVQDEEVPPTELQSWFLSSETNCSGFVGYAAASIANPWEEMTAEQLLDASGLSFGVPEVAENVIYRYLHGEGMAEMQFSWNGGEFCARILPAAELTDISGMYYEWQDERPISLENCVGFFSAAQDGECMVERCLWYDAAPGLTYSLTVIAADVNGLDLAAMAEQIYVPTQGES